MYQNKLFYLVLLLLALTFQIDGKTLTGKVVKVTDGDTFHLLDSRNRNYKIRMLGIDAPESSQAYGQKSKEQLAGYIAGETVTVTYTKEDRYGRILGTASTRRIDDVNYQMILSGYAWYYRLGNHIEEYENAEKAAKRRKAGLWKDKNPVNPYTYRKIKKQQHTR